MRASCCHSIGVGFVLRVDLITFSLWRRWFNRRRREDHTTCKMNKSNHPWVSEESKASGKLVHGEELAKSH